MFTITTEADLQLALQFIEENEVLAYDTETTGLNPRHDKVIGFGFSTADTGYYLPISVYDVDSDDMVLQDIAAAGIPAILGALAKKKLLMFNASFDARFTKFQLGVDLLPALHADVLLLKHTCDEEFPFGLKEIATKLWGHDVKKEKEEMQASIKSRRGKPTHFFKADRDTLAKYCVQDCLLTFRIFNHYSPLLKKEGLENFYYVEEVLPLYKEVTIPMEERGVRLDITKMQYQLFDINEDLQSLEVAIQEAIAPNLALFRTWFLNKDYPLQTATGKVPAWAKKYETQGEAFAAANPGAYMFNLQSKHHLKKLFFDTLGEEPLSRTPTGLPQVDEDFIEKMSQKYTWCEKLIEFNKLNKIKSTYIERLLEGAENGRYYASFMQHRTVSGRYAGDLQQLPRPLEPGQASALVVHYTNQIRSFILPDSECKLLSADYEQLEPSIFAHTSGDNALQAIFRTGRDFYSEVAIKTERLSSVTSEKTANNYLGRVNKSARQKAKAYSLGIAYGMTAYKLKFELGCSEQEAEKLVNDYLSAFPSLASWMIQSKESVKFKGFIRTQAGRIRHMPRAASIFKKYGACIDHDLQLWKQYNDYPEKYALAKLDRREYKNLLNNAINFQVQGLAASIMNRASIAIARKLASEQLKAAIVAQIHDELVLNVPINETEQVSALVKDIMENITKLDVPLRTMPQLGNNFKECK